MAMPSNISYNLRVHYVKRPWINSPFGTIGVEIRMRSRCQRQYQSFNGNIRVLSDRLTGLNRHVRFTIPFHVLSLPSDRERYFRNEFSKLINDPISCGDVTERMVSSVVYMLSCNRVDHYYGFILVAELEAVTIELADRQSMTLEMDMDMAMAMEMEMEREMAGAAHSGRNGALKSVIEGLKKDIVKEGVDEGTCMICLEEFCAGAEFTCIPCSHVFHHSCIVEWLEKSNSCPVCRFLITN